MKRKKFTELLNNVSKTMFWSDFVNNDTYRKKYIQKDRNFKYLSDSELSDAITQLKNFDSNLVWDKKFWGLSRDESICAIACGYADTLRKIKNIK